MYRWCFGDIKGVVLHFDHVLVGTESKEKHDEILNNIIEKATKLNIKFSLEKF